MDSATAARLIELNREFYTRLGEAFSATRRRIQPGVRRVLNQLGGCERILDLGCGNGEVARELARRGHRGAYLGVDFSLPLLREAEAQPESVTALTWADFSATFHAMDLTVLAAERPAFIPSPLGFEVIFCFATLHHIPSRALRINILRTVRNLLEPEGRFFHSNWQFLSSRRLRERIQPWEAAIRREPALNGLDPADLDAGDYLLDWRSRGSGVRYVHHYDAHELAELAKATGFILTDSFESDGESGALGLYQCWQRVP